MLRLWHTFTSSCLDDAGSGRRATTTEPSRRILAFSGFFFGRGIQPITSAPAGEYNQSRLFVRRIEWKKMATHARMCVYSVCRPASAGGGGEAGRQTAARDLDQNRRLSSCDCLSTLEKASPRTLLFLRSQERRWRSGFVQPVSLKEKGRLNVTSQGDRRRSRRECLLSLPLKRPRLPKAAAWQASQPELDAHWTGGCTFCTSLEPARTLKIRKFSACEPWGSSVSTHHLHPRVYKMDFIFWKSLPSF